MIVKSSPTAKYEIVHEIVKDLTFMFHRYSTFRKNAQQTQRDFVGRPGASRFPAAGLGAAQQAKVRAL